jgi:PKHD-type hydroxylase
MLAIDNNPNIEHEVLLLSPLSINNALTPSEIKDIQQIVSTLKLEKTTIGGEIRSDIHSANRAVIPYQTETLWIYGRLYDLVLLANTEGYRFDPLDFVEPMIYYEYDANDFYKWHTDIANIPPFSSRKLGVTVLINDSDDYRGGQIEFAMTPEPETFFVTPRSAGTIIIYPTYMPYRIQPITSGKKTFINFFLGGTSFK